MTYDFKLKIIIISVLHYTCSVYCILSCISFTNYQIKKIYMLLIIKNTYLPIVNLFFVSASFTKSPRGYLFLGFFAGFFSISSSSSSTLPFSCGAGRFCEAGFLISGQPLFFHSFHLSSLFKICFTSLINLMT